MWSVCMHLLRAKETQTCHNLRHWVIDISLVLTEILWVRRKRRRMGTVVLAVAPDPESKIRPNL